MPAVSQVAESKKALRAKYLAARKATPQKERARQDSAILQQFRGLSEYRNASLILAYVSYSSEVDTHALIEQALRDGKRVGVPRCAEEHKMHYLEIQSFDDLEPGYKGILEPSARLATPLTAEDMAGALCLVPGLAFDPLGFRIGYGGGYYDRFLAKFDGTKVALARPNQLADEPLPTDQYDIPVDYVVVPNTVIAI